MFHRAHDSSPIIQSCLRIRPQNLTLWDRPMVSVVPQTRAKLISSSRKAASICPAAGSAMNAYEQMVNSQGILLARPKRSA